MNGSSILAKILQHTSKKNNSIFIIQEDVVIEKLENIFLNGSNGLQVISDFDQTISRFKNDQKRNLTCHEVFEISLESKTDIREELVKLKSEYLPILFNDKLTFNEKDPLMKEFWIKGHGLLCQSKVTKKEIEHSSVSSNVLLRDGVCSFLKNLKKLNIPIVVFSTGIGDIIESIFQINKINMSNVKVISNFIQYDKENVIERFYNETIYTGNKTAHLFELWENYDQICSCRNNVLLLGNAIEDARMSDGLNENINILKIGFLNQYNSDSLKLFSNVYDIVLIEDETFTVPQIIIDFL